MKIVVLGYHDIGYECLRALTDLGADIRAVVTHADNPNENIWFKSVRDLAFENCLPVFQPKNVNDKRMIRAVRDMEPDMMFSFYFRQIVGKELLDIPKTGAYNLHGSLLPKYRGRCPVNWVLIHGEKETGLTLHRMEEKPDSGGIVAQRKVPIDFKDTAQTLFRKMSGAAYDLIREVYPRMLRGDFTETGQDHERASRFGGRKPEDGKIDWSKPAVEIYNLVRAVTHPYPGAFTCYNGHKLFIWWAEPDESVETEGKQPGRIIESSRADGIAVLTGKGVLRLKKIQWEGGSILEDKIVVESGGLTSGRVFDGV